MTNSPTGPASSTVVAVGRDGRVIDWPDSAAAMFGWTAEQAVGQELMALLGRASDSGPDPLASWLPFRSLGHYRHRDSSLLSCEAEFQPLQGAAGRWRGEVRLQRVDRAGPATPEFEAQCHAVVAAMQEGVVVYALDGRIVACNPSAERILGLRADQIHGRTPVDPRWRSVHEDGTPFAGGLHPAMITLQTGQPQSRVVMGVYQPNGVLTWIRINSMPLRLEAGAAHHAVVATFADITEERLLQAEVRARAEQLALVLDCANDGFWDWHIPSGRVTFSGNWAAMLGYSLDELAGDLSTWSRLVHADDMAAVQPVLQAHLRGETAFYSSEHRMRAKDGRWVWVLDRGKVVERTSDGRPLRAVGTHTDVTERRQAQDQLQMAQVANERLTAESLEARERVRALAALLPVCAACKCVRSDRGFWQQVDRYLEQYPDAKATHGLCPECGERLRQR